MGGGGVEGSDEAPVPSLDREDDDPSSRHGGEKWKILVGFGGIGGRPTMKGAGE